eukprot:767773-Hanusia_phi.AAC.6
MAALCNDPKEVWNIVVQDYNHSAHDVLHRLFLARSHAASVDEDEEGEEDEDLRRMRMRMRMRGGGGVCEEEEEEEGEGVTMSGRTSWDRTREARESSIRATGFQRRGGGGEAVVPDRRSRLEILHVVYDTAGSCYTQGREKGIRAGLSYLEGRDLGVELGNDLRSCGQGSLTTEVADAQELSRLLAGGVVA